MDWRHEAACRDEDPELFFPIGNTGPALMQIEEAKAVCRRCSVVDTCLAWALESGQDAGVWGGLSEDERRALKRRNARARRAAARSALLTPSPRRVARPTAEASDPRRGPACSTLLRRATRGSPRGPARRQLAPGSVRRGCAGADVAVPVTRVDRRPRARLRRAPR